MFTILISILIIHINPCARGVFQWGKIDRFSFKFLCGP